VVEELATVQITIGCLACIYRSDRDEGRQPLNLALDAVFLEPT